jgi:hypothetical protein
MTAALLACTDKSEQSIIFYDDHIEQNVIKELQAKGIPFRREDDTIWYLVNHKDEVLNVFHQVVAKRPVQYGFYDLDEKKRFQMLLSEKNIAELPVSDSGPMYIVLVPAEHRDRAEDIFQHMLQK